MPGLKQRLLLLGFLALSVGALGLYHFKLRGEMASPADVAASLAQGVAWIWPRSNGPLRWQGLDLRYREAAVLVESLRLTADAVEHGGRKQRLAVPESVRLLPVVHVETGDAAPDALSEAQSRTIIRALLRQAPAARAGAGMVQLDFEAPRRQRQSYIALVTALRAALPPEVRLSITALAHWCSEGDWLDRLPVDEVVPMLYRLGDDAAQWRQRFAQPAARLSRRCQGPAMGFATDEPPPRALLARIERPYWFDNAAWSNPALPPGNLEMLR
ncbi:MAG: hypothetical protein RIR00_2453 [Pseudomonadota bacterium]|jgi:hypothetical protein